MLDAIVAGGGPAGSSAAYALSRAGARVLLLERAAFPRTKVCGEYLSGGAQQKLKEIGVFDRVRSQAQLLQGVRLHVGDLAVSLRFTQPSLAIERATLDDILLSHARSAGVHVVQASLEDVISEGSEVCVQYRDVLGSSAEVRAHAVIGADGIGSIVARKSRLARPPKDRARFALGGHYAGFGALDSFVEMHVRPDAYFAINPLTSELANALVLVEPAALHAWRGAVDERLAELSAELSADTRFLHSVTRVGKRVAVGPLTQRVRAVARGRVFLAGDAAGFLDPFTGQGVFLALATGAQAAACVGAALRGEVDWNDAGAAYAREHRAIFGSRRRLAALVSLLVKHQWLARRAARNLKRSESLAREVMAAVGGLTPAEAILNPFQLLRLVA